MKIFDTFRRHLLQKLSRILINTTIDFIFKYVKIQFLIHFNLFYQYLILVTQLIQNLYTCHIRKILCQKHKKSLNNTFREVLKSS